MTNRKYVSGANFERQVKKQWEEDGWIVVRSAGSHGPADLVAAKGGIIRWIQCKTDGNLSKKEIDALKRVVKIGGGIALLAYKEKIKGKNTVTVVRVAAMTDRITSFVPSTTASSADFLFNTWR